MRLYRFYTEDLNRNRVRELVFEHCMGASFIFTKGYWNNGNGKVYDEDSLIVEVIEQDEWYQQARFLAARIRDTNSQESVLLTVSKLENSEMI